MSKYGQNSFNKRFLNTLSNLKHVLFTAFIGLRQLKIGYLEDF